MMTSRPAGSVALLPLVVASVLVLSSARAAGQATVERPGGSRPVRLVKPRIAPLPEAQWTDIHRNLVAKHLKDERPGNGFKTLLHVPPLVDAVMPFQNYITHESSLSTRHREILILRTAWLLGSEYFWSEHAPIARKAGLSSDDLRRIAQGPDARGWDTVEATLLRLADQLFRNSFINDATWKALAASYDMYHLMDAVMTVADFTTVSLLYNSLGVQPDDWAADRMPTDIPYRVVVPAREPPLKAARIEPMEGTGLAIGRTFARYPKLATPRSTGSNYVNQGSKLDPRYRELLILRIGWNCQSEYEWAQHVGSVGRARERGLDPVRIAQGATAPGWDPFEATLLRSADELYRDSIVSDQTWNQLAARFDTTMLMNAVITTANYRMVSMALNALGVQLDPGDERFPRLQSDAGALPRPGFHHLHMNSPNPAKAIDEFLAVYPASTKKTFAGLEGLQTANNVMMLFTRVSTPPPIPGPDRITASTPQTAFWHHVWSVTDGRATLKRLRDADPKFDATRFIPQYTGPDGKTVDFSSDTYAGFLTTRQVEEAKQKGVTPTHKGGYFNWYGPDGVVMETADGGPEAYRIVGMFQEQPYCAVIWYRTHLNAADRPAGGGRGPAEAPRSEADCKVSRGTDVSWPSTYKRGHFRVPPAQSVYFDDVQLRWYMNQENRPLVSTRGQLLDHIALSVADLDAWVAKLRREGVRFLEQPYMLGNTRAVMIEGPGREALELVELASARR